MISRNGVAELLPRDG